MASSASGSMMAVEIRGLPDKEEVLIAYAHLSYLKYGA